MPRRSSNKAAALIIVLAFVFLLTGLSVAYLSRSNTDRQLAHTSFHYTDADLLAQSALDIVVGDFRQEIQNGSTQSGPLWVPTSAANVVPMYNPTPTPGTTPAIPNLIRRSVRSETALWPDSVTGPAVGSRASAVNSATDISANSRSISTTRWNKHYLIPRPAGASPNDTTPDPTVGFTAPDWVIVTREGVPSPTPYSAWDPILKDPTAANTKYAVGRYAYAVYDEGGLLDMNAAGYSSPTTILQYGRKGSLAFADLTGLPGLSTTAVDNIVGWRNYASSQPSGVLPNLSFSANATNTYYNFILSDPTNIQLTNYFTGSPLAYFTNSFLKTSGATVSGNRTDQQLIARKELIGLLSAASSGVSYSNALQSLGTFSREALANVPQWTGPNPPTSINPNFQTLLVTASFTRNDGTMANVGDPLVNKRFLLQRLNWLTYRGPSATRTIPASAPALGDPNYDMWLLTRGAAAADANSIRFGLTSAFLQQGTATNIQKYFGLVWDSTNERWNYVGQGPSLLSSIATFGVGGTQAATREPDFFELLQAGIILPSSIDDDNYSPDGTLLPVVHQKSKMLHILTIGANLIAQSRADSYPVRIACTVNGTTMEAVGATRLPYLNSLAVCPVAGTSVPPSSPTGGINWLLVPNLWDPFRDTWDLTEANAGNGLNGPNLTPGYLRPPVQITVTGTVGLGTVVAGSSVTTGMVSSALVTPSPSPLVTVTISPAQSLLLTSPTASPAAGVNGFLEASRITSADVTPVPAAFTPTTSVSAAAAAWNSVIYPTPTVSPTPVGTNVVFRISFPGTSIPAAWATATPRQNPVLMLRPGFQMTLDYKSPNGTWYSYSFLQGNNEPSTWISGSVASNPSLNVTTTWSVYGRIPRPNPTPQPAILFASPSPTASQAPTLWDVTTLADAPMFAKADPRSMRYNSQVGVVHITSPTPTVTPLAAGIIRAVWPSGFLTPPIMTVGSSPAPTPTQTPNPTPTPSPTGTPTPNYNPALYSQLGDNGPAGSNPYSEAGGDVVRPVIMNRPFRSVGEMGYAFRDQPFRTLSFSSANSPDAGLLDLFTTNNYSDSSGMRAGVISLNSRQAPALASVLTNTIRREDTPRQTPIPPGVSPSPQPSPLDSPTANSVATSLTSLTLGSPLVNRAGLATLIASETGLGTSVPKTQRESIARALGETVQTRTWNLLIDLIAQTGHYAPNAQNLGDFIVEGEKRYWLHVAIDRFDASGGVSVGGGAPSNVKVLSQQLEEVTE